MVGIRKAETVPTAFELPSLTGESWIVALTARNPDEFRPEAMEYGFDDLLPKPLDRQVLIDRCASFVSVTA